MDVEEEPWPLEMMTRAAAETLKALIRVFLCPQWEGLTAIAFNSEGQRSTRSVEKHKV